MGRYVEKELRMRNEFCLRAGAIVAMRVAAALVVLTVPAMADCDRL